MGCCTDMKLWWVKGNRTKAPNTAKINHVNHVKSPPFKCLCGLTVEENGTKQTDGNNVECVTRVLAVMRQPFDSPAQCSEALGSSIISAKPLNCGQRQNTLQHLSNLWNASKAPYHYTLQHFHSMALLLSAVALKLPVTWLVCRLILQTMAKRGVWDLKKISQAKSCLQSG